MTDTSPKLTALLVDDELMMRQMLKLIVEEVGLSIVGEATNGDDAIALCRRYKPRLVCLDLNMPKKDGIETLKILRPEFPDTRFVIITADASADKVTKAIENGANGFILKPFNTAQVMERLQKILSIDPD